MENEKKAYWLRMSGDAKAVLVLAGEKELDKLKTGTGIIEFERVNKDGSITKLVVNSSVVQSMNENI